MTPYAITIADSSPAPARIPPVHFLREIVSEETLTVTAYVMANGKTDVVTIGTPPADVAVRATTAQSALALERATQADPEPETSPLYADDGFDI